MREIGIEIKCEADQVACFYCKSPIDQPKMNFKLMSKYSDSTSEQDFLWKRVLSFHLCDTCTKGMPIDKVKELAGKSIKMYDKAFNDILDFLGKEIKRSK